MTRKKAEAATGRHAVDVSARRSGRESDRTKVLWNVAHRPVSLPLMNGAHATRQIPLLAAIGALSLAVLPASPVRAASILWGTPTFITADTDVSTTGSLLYAYNFGAAAGTSAGTGLRGGSTSVEPASVPTATVNGVTFAPFAVPHLTSATVTVGSVSLDVNLTNQFYTTNDLTGSISPPFANLTTAYKGLLQSGVATLQTNGTLTLTLGGLTNGQSYLVEFWTSNARNLLTFQTAGTTYTAGNAVTLDDSNTNGTGGVGQWVTGSFTANAATEVLTLQSSTPASDYPVINGFQVRPVPEPSSTLLLLSGAAPCLRRCTVRKATHVA
jgi:hypothetical protein